MTIYYWSGVTGAHDLLEQHQSTIQRLLNRDYNTNDLERLNCTSKYKIYSFRLNQTERLLFTEYNGYLVVLEHLPTHDYHKSKFLQHHVLDRFIEKQSITEQLSFNAETNQKNQPLLKSFNQAF